jgi:hypothetical protein
MDGNLTTATAGVYVIILFGPGAIGYAVAPPRTGYGTELWLVPYYIYGKFNDPVYPPEARIDYLMPTEPYRYAIKQYQCADLKALEQKLLQFPAGSIFSAAHTGSLLNRWGDWTKISAFLKSHGHSFRN